MSQPVALLAAAWAASAALFAQEPGRLDADRSSPIGPQDFLRDWRLAYGDSWVSHLDPRTGMLELLFGGNAEPSFLPDTSVDADWYRLGREWIAATEPMHGIEAEELVDTRVMFLPLAQGNTTDKMTVRFDQVIDGVPVEGGRVNVLFDTVGRLLSVHSTAAPTIEDRSTRPAFDGGFASLVAREAFFATEGVEPNHYGAPKLVFAHVDDQETRRWTLAWQVDAQWLVDGFEPRGITYTIDARTRRILRRASSIHYFDVTGTISTMATPGTAADHPGNPPTMQPVPYARVTSSAGTVFTNAAGNFTFPGVNSPLNVTVTYTGTFTNVTNAAGSPYSITFNNVQPNQPNALLMNPTPTQQVTAQANGFVWVNRLRDWVRSIFPNDTTADFLSTTNVNQNQTCNAFFNGTSTNYFLAGGGCNNTSYSSVVAHEMGHWLNVLYGTDNGPDGMGEGNADIFSMYMLDEPLIAPFFFTNGNPIRDGNNSRQFCGDSSPGCHGGVHNDGEVWMGAAWKIRSRLNATLGNGPGDLQSSLLFMGWMNSYNQTQIRSIIESQWLTLDDNDGNINNGTPNYTAIDGGFRAQGFPGFGLQFIDFSNVTVLPSTTNQAGPYVVNATITAGITPPVTSATLRYRVNNGPVQNVPMTTVGPNTYAAAIPGQPAPAAVEYVIDARDAVSNLGSYPSVELSQGLHFGVGIVSNVQTFDFEAGPSGWFRTAGGVASGGWIHDDPNGTAAQPEDDHTPAPGTKCWFTGQATAGSPLGTNDVDAGATTLSSGRFDVTGVLVPRISYWRWFSNNQGSAPGEDTFVVQISNNGGTSWTTVETVGPNGPEAAGGWYRREFFPNTLVTPTDNMRIRFTAADIGAESIVEAAVDDVQISSLESIVAPPSNYCTVNPNSTGQLGSISFEGSQSVFRNEAALRGQGFPLGVFGLFYFGSAQAQAPIAGTQAIRCVGGTTFRLPITDTDSLFGAAYFPLDFTSSATPAQLITGGTTWYFQFWHRDAVNGVATSNTSNGLRVEFGF